MALDTSGQLGPGGPYRIAEGDSLSLQVDAAALPGGGAGYSFTWDINGDGLFGDALGPAPTLAWSQLQALGIADGPEAWRVSVRATSGGTSTESLATSLYVADAPPRAALLGSGGIRGELRSFTLQFLDPGDDVMPSGNVTYDIDWNGDGSYDESLTGPRTGVNVSHRFSQSGTASVGVRVTSGTVVVDTRSFPITTTDWALRDDGQGQTDLWWGGTPGIDGVYFYTGTAGRVTIFAQLENLTLVNKVSQVSGVTGRVLAWGYEGADALVAEFLTSRVAIFDGGPGNDTLVGGFLGDVLEGGEGDDLLIGGTQATDGGDWLSGGEGRDLLIGHRGADSLLGGAGEDLLVGGAVHWSNYPTAIYAVQSEWRSGRSYAERVANILGTGTGPRANGNWLLRPGQEVTDDGAVDHLWGGTELDWLVLRILQDVSEDDEPGETLSDF